MTKSASTTAARRRWPRRLALAGGGLVVLVLMALFLAWWFLPAIVRAGFDRGTRAVGFEEAAIAVDRADLSGLRASALRLRLGGLAVALDAAAADFAVTELAGGRVSRVDVDGLRVALDFTQPRQGLLPDAIGALLAQIPSSDDPLVWPVGELAFRRCQLVLVLPEGTETLPLSGSAVREADGRIAFTLTSEHPQLGLGLSGRVRTETMDGELQLDRLDAPPAFVLDLLARLGVWRMPDALKFDTDRFAISATATLKSGALESYAGQVRAPRVHLQTGDLECELTDAVLDVTSPADAGIRATLRGMLGAHGVAQPWNVEPALVDITLDRGTIQASLARTAVAFGEMVAAPLALTTTVGIPGMGGPAQVELQLEADDAVLGGVRVAPLAIHATGWVDQLAVSVPELALADASPATVKNLTVEVRDPFGTARSIAVSADVVGNPAAAGFLPAGWKLVEPALPAAALRLEGRMESGDTGIKAVATLRGLLDKVAMEVDGATFACVPAAEIKVALEDGAVSLDASVEAKEIASNVPKFPPGVKALRVAVEVPRAPLQALDELAGGDVPQAELAAKVSASVFQSETRGDAYVSVRHFGDAAEWTAEIWGMLDNVSGAWAGAQVEGLRAEVTVDSGRVPDARVGEWLRAPEWRPLVRAALPQTKVDVSLTAASLDRPGVGRTEWAGFWVQKPRVTEDKPLLESWLQFSSGVLRAGPELLEQPEIKLHVAGSLDEFTVDTTAQALVEGSRLALKATPRVRFDWDTFAASVEGVGALEPFTLTNSDVVTRWVPTAKGIAVTATLAGSGRFAWATSGSWDGALNLSLLDGHVNIPDQGFRVEGIHTGLAIASLREMRTDTQVPVGFARLAIGEIEVTNASALVSTDGLDRVTIDALKARVFGGDVSVGTFTLVFPAPDVGIALEFEGVDAGELARQVDIFKGTVTGKLRGKLPVGLLAGRPYFGEGYLELDPRVPARFSMDARGLFTTDLPDQTTKDKVVRLPYEVLEEALGDVEIQTMRLDFFNRETPDTPVRIEFSGVSDTRRAHVPLHIVTNLNGSVPEVLNLLFRVATW